MATGGLLALLVVTPGLAFCGELDIEQIEARSMFCMYQALVAQGQLPSGSETEDAVVPDMGRLRII
jgi:hypothetical protein